MFFGEEAFGLPMSVLASVRHAMAGAGHFNVRTGCVATALEVGFRESGDPVRLYSEHVISSLFDLFRDAPSSLRAGMVRTWAAARARATSICNSSLRWTGVTGVVSAAVNSFLDWGWDPISPVELVSPEGVRFHWDTSPL